MKIVLKGWIGRSVKRKSDLTYLDEDYHTIMIDHKRGREVDWAEEDWPPRKVTVTITDEEQP